MYRDQYYVVDLEISGNMWVQWTGGYSQDITWALKEDVLEAAGMTIWKHLGNLKLLISSVTLLSGWYDGFQVIASSNGTKRARIVKD